MLKIIKHLDKTFTTKHYDKQLTKAEICIIRDNFKTDMPTIKSVISEMHKLYTSDRVLISNTYNLFFYPLMIKCRIKNMSWSILEFMQSDDLIRFASAKIKAFPKVFKPQHSFNVNLKAIFRLTPSGTASKLSNFPYRTAKDIIKRYNINGNYYDYSAGWGVRLLASLSNGVNYYATEPNFQLAKNLEATGAVYKEVNNLNTKVKIKTHGSEILIDKWKNKMGLAFSSPPYFDLEIYNNADTQSIIKYPDYEKWLKKYWKKTVQNINTYLINEGHLLLNIKDIKGFNLVDDMCNIVIKNNFVFVESFELKNINRVILHQNNKHTNELIYVFKKLVNNEKE